MSTDQLPENVRLGPEGYEAVQAVLDLMDGRIERGTVPVYEWPEDEVALHRSTHWLSFTDRADGVSRLRAEKIVQTVLNVYAHRLDRDMRDGATNV